MSMDMIVDLDDAARKILERNDKGTYTVPTHGLYPYQWNWDSAFAAFGFAQFDCNRGWVELETLFSGQWDSGMVPHILFHNREDEDYFPGPGVWDGIGPIPSSGITQPPIAATMALLMWDRDPDMARDRMQPMFEKMVAWHDWIIKWRMTEDGAIFTTHPWETGRDNAPDWDIALAGIDPVGVGEYKRRDLSHVDNDMRPTKYDYDRYIWLVKRGASLDWNDEKTSENAPLKVAEPMMTFTFLRAQRDLIKLGHLLGRDVSALEASIPQLEAGAQTLWNPLLGAYDSRDLKSGKWSNAISNASFLCWYAGLDAPEMVPVLKRVTEDMSYGVPSLDPHDPRFDSKRYWRGPVWGVVNMLIGMGMNDKGMPEGAELRKSTADLIHNHGFSEYFDPQDGAPAGGQSFTWTAAVWLGWASPNARQI